MTVPRRSLFFGAITLGLLLPRVSFSECADYSENLHWIGGSPLVQDVNRAVFVGDLLYLGTGCLWNSTCSGSLEIFDMADPLHPVHLGTLATSGSVRDLVVVGNVAYLAEGDSGLLTVDVTDPMSPSVLAGWSSADGQDVEVEGTTAYLLTDDSFFTIDVSDPSSPSELGNVGYGGTGLAVAAGHAYLMPELRILDVSDPGSPAVVVADFLPDDDPLHEGQVVVDGSVLFCLYHKEVIGTEVFEVRVAEAYDVTTPSSPVLISGLARDHGTNGLRFAVGNDEIYANWGGVAVLDVSGSWTDTGSWSVPATELEFRDGVLYTFAGGAVHLFGPGPLGGEAIVGSVDAGTSDRVLWLGDHAYLFSTGFVSPEPLLQVVDLSDAMNPSFVGGFFGSAGVTSLDARALDQDHIVLNRLDDSTFENEINVIDVAEPMSPVLLPGVVFDPIETTDVVVDGAFGYSIGWNPIGDVDEIRPIDFSIPAAPVLGAAVAAPDGAVAGAVVNAHLLTVDGSRLSSFSLADPMLPVFEATLDIAPYVAHQISARDDFAYVTATNAGHAYLLTIDCTNPVAPGVVDAQFVPRTGRMVVDGDLLVIAGGDYFGLTDPAMPMPLPGVRIDHDTRTFDVSNGRLVRSVVYTTGGGPSFVYETTVLDLPCTDPSDVAGPEPHVAVRPTFTAWPNPASTTQQIRFRIAPGSEFAKDGSTLLSIYDANGRSVRTLTADATAEGEVIAEWDGADGNGFRVPSGVYWAGLRSAGVAAASGVVIRVR